MAEIEEEDSHFVEAFKYNLKRKNLFQAKECL
jgi:hypothetical protein